QRARERPAAVAERPCGPLLARPVLRAGRPQRARGGGVFRVPHARTEMESVNDTTPLVPLLHAAVFGSRRGTVAGIRHPGPMSVTPDESAPSRVPRSGEHDRARAQGPGSSSRDRFESFIEPPIVGIGGSVTGARRLLCPYNFEACRARVGAPPVVD